jgi:small subunit ribosomal protein S21
MIHIQLSKEKNLESALKKLKRRFEKDGTKKELLQRKEFVKDSIKDREKKNKAKYIQSLRDIENGD